MINEDPKKIFELSSKPLELTEVCSNDLEIGAKLELKKNCCVEFCSMQERTGSDFEDELKDLELGKKPANLIGAEKQQQVQLESMLKKRRPPSYSPLELDGYIFQKKRRYWELGKEHFFHKKWPLFETLVQYLCDAWTEPKSDVPQQLKDNKITIFLIKCILCRIYSNFNLTKREDLIHYSDPSAVIESQKLNFERLKRSIHLSKEDLIENVRKTVKRIMEGELELKEIKKNFELFHHPNSKVTNKREDEYRKSFISAFLWKMEIEFDFDFITRDQRHTKKGFKRIIFIKKVLNPGIVQMHDPIEDFNLMRKFKKFLLETSNKATKIYLKDIFRFFSELRFEMIKFLDRFLYFKSTFRKMQLKRKMYDLIIGPEKCEASEKKSVNSRRIKKGYVVGNEEAFPEIKNGEKKWCNLVQYDEKEIPEDIKMKIGFHILFNDKFKFSWTDKEIKNALVHMRKKIRDCLLEMFESRRVNFVVPRSMEDYLGWKDRFLQSEESLSKNVTKERINSRSKSVMPFLTIVDEAYHQLALLIKVKIYDFQRLKTLLTYSIKYYGLGEINLEICSKQTDLVMLFLNWLHDLRTRSDSIDKLGLSLKELDEELLKFDKFIACLRLLQNWNLYVKRELISQGKMKQDEPELAQTEKQDESVDASAFKNEGKIQQNQSSEKLIKDVKVVLSQVQKDEKLRVKRMNNERNKQNYVFRKADAMATRILNQEQTILPFKIRRIWAKKLDCAENDN